MKNNQKGITLIALVVTIIVLLILAGVSIAMLTGQNGILNRADEAGWKSKLADAQDTVSLEVSNQLVDYYADMYTGNGTGTETGTVSDLIEEACTNAQTTLGNSQYTITHTKAVEGSEGVDAKPETITIVYKANEQKSYQVVGTLNGSKVGWGTMTATGN